MLKTILSLMVLLQACTTIPPETEDLVKLDTSNNHPVDDF
jgi:hypothetical protein